MRHRHHLYAVLTCLAVAVALVGWPSVRGAGPFRVLAWNNLGMHCLDSDFSVFSILPPYNTIAAQVIDPTGQLVASDAAVSVTYEGVADALGSINTTSVAKTNFWAHVQALFGVALAPDVGLAGKAMPGPANVPQAMTYEGVYRTFGAEGIPITPYDDARAKNPYPLMKLVVRQGTSAVASTSIVLPVSDEMDCRACHSSSSADEARPPAGWANDPDPDRDYRLNVIRLHDALNAGDDQYASALTWAGYDAAGLAATVLTDGTPVLCAKCHASNALATAGYPGLPPLTQAVHGRHAGASDPDSGLPLDASANRTACYRCHPGSATRCLRGAMGAAVAADGTMAMQCQSCHGSMSAVGAAGRQGWLDEPACQSCHTGTAVDNKGQIRFTSVFNDDGTVRTPANGLFATNADTPSAGLSLYRFSAGHGHLQCAACHGSTHAEYPSTHESDNIQSESLQGHDGVIAECAVCHADGIRTVSGGPHGLHPLGQTWVEGHKDPAEEGAAACRACHGPDDRGTVLSRALGDRTLTAFGTKAFWQGYQIGCYTCHNGPTGDDRNPNRPPVATGGRLQTDDRTPASIDLQAADADGDVLALRIVSQPAEGTVALSGRRATYYPRAGFSGDVLFTFAANDGAADSNLAEVAVHVVAGAVLTPGTPSSATATGTQRSETATPTATGTAGPTEMATATGTGEPRQGRIYLPVASRRSS